MRKKYLAALLAFVTISLVGCYDLDRYPADQIGKFYKNEEHAKEAMMAVYSNMKYEDVFGLQFAMDGLGGIAMGYDYPSYLVIQRGRYDVREARVHYKWRYVYEGIARANNVLQNIDKCEMSEELKVRYKAEAKFMRALYYFSLLDYFGGVPIYDESVVVAKSYSEMKAPRNTADEVRQFVLKDLTEAANILPEEWPKADYGRATKYAAIGLQGKVYLFNHAYDKAAECFKKIVDSKKFALYDNYADLFKPGGDESSEMIFAIQNMGGVGTDQGMPMCFYMGTRSTYGSCWNNVMAASSFVDQYEYKDGKPFNWETWFPGFTTDNKVKADAFVATLNTKTGYVAKYPAGKEKLLEMYKQRDPRMEASVILPYTSYIGWYKNETSPCEYVIAKGIVDGKGYIRTNQGYLCYLWRKFVPESNMGGALNSRFHTPINFPLIRYADVLLMLAECENELGHQAAAVDLINQVRARKSVNMPGINSGPEWLKATTKEEVFARIQHERAVELAAEGHSFSDMKRWKLLETLNGKAENDVTGKECYKRVVTARDYLWPIPANEIEQNDKLTQNPDW